MRHVYRIGCLAGLLLACAWAGSAAADRNFSQYPGFAEYFAANPPAEAAGQADRALARRHAPRFHLPAGHEGPIDFYRDYIAHGYLMTGDGVRIDGPTASDLNRYLDDVRAEFTHVPGTAEPRPVVYSTVVRSGLWAPREPDRAAEEFTVVSYHLAFRVSGLPAGLSVAAAIPLRLVAVRHPPALRLSTPESPRCFCLAAAIRIHTGSVLCRDPTHTGEPTETMCGIYTRIGRIYTRDRDLDAADFEPHLNAIIDWNDTDKRSYEDVRDLTAATLRHLDTARFGPA